MPLILRKFEDYDQEIKTARPGRVDLINISRSSPLRILSIFHEKIKKYGILILLCPYDKYALKHVKENKIEFQ